MKSIEQKRMEALARREKDLEFWQRALKRWDDDSDESTIKHFNSKIKSKIKAAERDIANLRKKLGR